MSVSRIATRYAKPLLDLALENNKLDIVVSDIETFQKALKNRDLYLLMKSPIIKFDKKLDIVSAIFKGKVDDLTFSFVELMINKGRENVFPEIVDAFIAQYKVYKKITSVTLITAKPLLKSELDSIKSKLINSDITDESIEVTEKVDPSIIGGFVIKIGDKLYDASVIHKLDQLKKKLSSNDYVKAN